MSDNSTPAAKRVSREQYYMGIATAVRERANCTGRRVGAVIVKDDRVIATGYNGTPSNMANCDEGGCFRCNNPDDFPPGAGYDQCICVHAEQNALMTAARFGIAVDGATFYSTMRPCFGCTKEMLQAGIKGGYYLHNWVPVIDELIGEYIKIQNRFPEGIRRVEMPDPRGDWWLGRSAAAASTAQTFDENVALSLYLQDKALASLLQEFREAPNQSPSSEQSEND